MNRTLHRPWALIGLSLLLAACSKPETRPEAVRAVRTLVVAPASADGVQEYAAEVRARTESRLSFRVPGKMLSRAVEVGQRVKPGDVLARLDPEDLRLAQDAARAALQAAQANHDLSVADYRRFRELRDQGFISGAELDRREATLKAAAAQLEQARAQAAVQGNQAAYTALTAPAAGVVVGVDAEPGAVLSAGSPVLRLALDGPRDAVFSVPEDAVRAMQALIGRAGALKVRPWGRGEAVAATVREVGAAADPVTRTFLVKAGLGGGELQLGQTATVLIELPRQPGVTLLPLTAVREHLGRSAVWVVEGANPTVRLRPIDVAGAQGNEVVVRGGLKPGEQVVTAGVHVLTEGQPVKLMAAAPAQAASAAVR